jgi:hypothetical protein
MNRSLNLLGHLLYAQEEKKYENNPTDYVGDFTDVDTVGMRHAIYAGSQE